MDWHKNWSIWRHFGIFMLRAPPISIQGYGTFGDKAGIIYRRFINPSKLYAKGGFRVARKQEQFGEEPGRRAKPLSQLSRMGIEIATLSPD